MKKNNLDNASSKDQENEIEYIVQELRSLIRSPKFIRTIYQFGFLMIGYFFLTIISQDYSVFRTLVWMGLFFLIGLLIPLPNEAKIEDEDFK